ncbi:MAG: hypothetical protein Q7T67_14585 [Patulibacter sp.]|nr:hypothetical protein [Patulibacter sp.]
MPHGERAFGLRPVAYEAATDSDVVTYDDPDTTVRVVARVPRSGATPSLVLRTAPDTGASSIAW